MSVLAAALIAFVPVQSEATEPVVDVPERCEWPKPVQRSIASLREAPDIAAEFKRQGLAIADTGELYVPYDVIDGAKKLPHRQFLRAYAFADRTIVWYYHGGSIASHVHVAEMRLQRDRRDEPFVLRLTGRSLTGAPCAASRALIEGVSRADDW